MVDGTSKKWRTVALAALGLTWAVPAQAQLGGIIGGSESSGLLSDIGGVVDDVLDGVGDTVEGLGDAVGNAVDGVGEAVDGLGNTVEGLLGPIGGDGVVSQNGAVLAVQQNLAIPLSALLEIVSRLNLGQVIDVQLIAVSQTLYYEVKLLGDRGIVFVVYFLAANGQQVNPQEIFDARVGGGG